MSGPSNQDKLKGLQAPRTDAPGGKVPPKSNSPAHNQESLAQLHQPTAPLSHPSVAAPPVSVAAQPVNRVGRARWRALALCFMAAALLLAGLTYRGARSDSTSVGSAAPAGANSIASPDPVLDSSLFGPPSSIPKLVEAVTASTIMIECSLGQGSGFALDVTPLSSSSKPVLVTNQHVIEGCEAPGALTITSSRGTFSGSALTWDKKSDLALIDVPGLSLSPLRIASSPQIGEWVMALGSPLGIKDTASFGAITNVVPEEALITSDAVLGPGNSGGPLVNNRGEVVGVNSAVFKDATGISLSTAPSELCRKLLACN